MYQTREEIENWLKEMKIKKYVINEDLTVSVNRSVNLSYKNLKKIPVKFKIIDGYFDCSYNNLTNLEGCPKEINGSFICSYNKLTSLKGCPEVVNGYFDCSKNKLTSLEYCSKEIYGGLNCYSNNLTSLQGCPKIIKKEFMCNNNNLTSLEYCPEVIHDDFSCSHNQLTSLEYFPLKIKGYCLNISSNKIKEEDLINFDCVFENIVKIYSDFNECGNIEEFLDKMNYYKNIKKENELLKNLSVNKNNMKLNNKL